MMAQLEVLEEMAQVFATAQLGPEVTMQLETIDMRVRVATDLRWFYIRIVQW